MILANRADELAGRLRGRVALSVGVFDGVHRGHQAVFAALREEARRHEASTLIVTLDPHPLQVVRPPSAPPLLTIPSERVRLLARMEPDAVLVHPFDRATAGLDAAEFLRILVPEGAHLVRLVVGYDFRMGKDREGGFEELRREGSRHGWSVLQVDPTMELGQPISSSRIRRLVTQGRVAEAAGLLGHFYTICGRVVPGRGVGRTLRFPTANVDAGDERKLLPQFGVYAVNARILNGEEAEPRLGVANIGVRPTFGGGEPTVEVHLPDWEGDLRDRGLEVEIVERIRDEASFDGPEALAARIAEDVTAARRILRNPA